jgi:hypothetical protein
LSITRCRRDRHQVGLGVLDDVLKVPRFGDMPLQSPVAQIGAGQRCGVNAVGDEIGCRPALQFGGPFRFRQRFERQRDMGDGVVAALHLCHLASSIDRKCCESCDACSGSIVINWPTTP